MATVLEYFCPGCGWFPQMPVTPENEKAVKAEMESKVAAHNKKCKNFKKNA